MAKDEDRPSSSIQESLLTAIGYGGKDASVLTTIITIDHFDPVYRTVASRIIDHRRKFGEAPGAGHLDDIFSDILGNPDNKNHDITRRILIGMREQERHLNLNYVISNVRDFARTQSLKNGIMAAADRWQQEDEERIEDVERILNDTLRDRINTIDPGTFFTDLDRVFLYQEKNENDYFLTGIPEFDKYGFTPHVGEIDVFIAPPKKGKSWWCHYLGRMAAMAHWPTLHITLENAETIAVPRYLQTFHALSKRIEDFRGVRFVKNDRGEYKEMEKIVRHTKGTIGDPKLRDKLKISQHLQDFIITKAFPTRQLTLRMLENYLDYIDAAHGFQPKLVILDAPYLMKLSTDNYRLDLGSLFMELRGLAQRRSFALVTTHQGNRESSEARTVNASHVAEDFSIIATCDRAVTYSQTKAERRLGAARLFASASRNDADQFMVMIAQNYGTGQFKLDSVPFKDEGYFDEVDAMIADFNAEDFNKDRNDQSKD